MTRLVTDCQRLATSGAWVCKTAITFAPMRSLIADGHERSMARRTRAYRQPGDRRGH